MSHTFKVSQLPSIAHSWRHLKFRDLLCLDHMLSTFHTFITPNCYGHVQFSLFDMHHSQSCSLPCLALSLKLNIVCGNCRACVLSCHQALAPSIFALPNTIDHVRLSSGTALFSHPSFRLDLSSYKKTLHLLVPSLSFETSSIHEIDITRMQM